MLSFRVLIAVVLLLAGGAAYAQLSQTGAGKVASSSPPPACGNEYDFSDACNSQYLPLI